MLPTRAGKPDVDALLRLVDVHSVDDLGKVL